ncbi:hypothetical protein JCM3770_004297, partial [Rhodotorula araucariae]
MAQTPTQFTGQAALTEADGKALKLQPWSYTPKKFHPDDVDIKVACSGVCGSCIHTITNGWPRPTSYPA